MPSYCWWDERHQPAPPAVLSSRDSKQRRVNMGRLKPETKRKVWEILKVESPGLASLLGDPNVTKMQQEFSPVTITIAWDDLPASAQQIIATERRW